jgi:hypothetical protein
LFHGKGHVEEFADFTKYYNDKFEVLVFDNRLIVKDKRMSHKTVIYNNLTIAKANLIGVVG